MSEKTHIAWCDSTLNFWEGCTKVSAGCANCYAEARDKRFHGESIDPDHPNIKHAPHWGKGAPRRKSVSAVKDAFKYNRKPWICDNCGQAFSIRCQHEIPGRVDKVLNQSLKVVESVTPARPCTGSVSYHRRRIFSLSLGDWLDSEVPIEWLAEMLDTIRQCDQVTWILCTKRPELWRERMDAILNWQSATGEGKQDEVFFEWIEAWTDCIDMPERGDIPRNITLLTSVENQEAADIRIPELLKIPAACRGLSLEPLLGPVMLSGEANGLTYNWLNHYEGYPDISWLIIGGESGPNARLCDTEWIRSLVSQGQSAGVAVFVKQLGASSGQTHSAPNSRGIPLKIRDPKGADPAEWPEDLRVQEWPKGGRP